MYIVHISYKRSATTTTRCTTIARASMNFFDTTTILQVQDTSTRY